MKDTLSCSSNTLDLVFIFTQKGNKHNTYVVPIAGIYKFLVIVHVLFRRKVDVFNALIDCGYLALIDSLEAKIVQPGN